MVLLKRSNALVFPSPVFSPAAWVPLRATTRMMPVQVRFYTDPACPWSWAAEPALRRLMWEFEEELEFVWVMGGLARRYGREYRDEEGRIGQGPDCFADLISHWLEVAADGRMPTDPRIWTESPLTSTYPACQAVKAASEQGADAAYRYLRRLREGIMFERRKLDHLDSLIAAAGPAGLDRERFEVDLRSHAITEAFGADLDQIRDPPQEARDAGAVRHTEGHERIAFPSALFIGEDGNRHGVWRFARSQTALREAALAAGAKQVNQGSLEPLDAIHRFGRCATLELEVLAERPQPVVEAELWGLARDWKLKPVPALTGTIWELA
jgi:predicted DsbA family dithiol-disulfide isomerase